MGILNSLKKSTPSIAPASTPSGAPVTPAADAAPAAATPERAPTTTFVAQKLPLPGSQAGATPPASGAGYQINPPDGTPAEQKVVATEAAKTKPRGRVLPDWVGAEYAGKAPEDVKNKVPFREVVIPALRARLPADFENPLVDAKGQFKPGLLKEDFVQETHRLLQALESLGASEPRTAEAAPPAAAPPASPPAAAPESTRVVFSAKELPAGKQDCELFVGCEPDGEPVSYLDEILPPFCQKAAALANQPHYALIPFGQAPHLVAAALASALEAGELKLPPILVIRFILPLSDACLAVLLRHVRRVVGRR